MQKSQNDLEILILQHPQEKSKNLATAPLLIDTLSRAQIKVGLSWANLTKALGRQTDPKKWAVLFVGSQASAKKSKPIPPNTRLEGIVVLDGNWSQAKALWWRNAWLLKLHRIVLSPEKPSLYNQLRKEPRRECLSTLESVELAMRNFGGTRDRAAAQDLHEKFLAFIKTAQKGPQPPEHKP